MTTRARLETLDVSYFTGRIDREAWLATRQRLLFQLSREDARKEVKRSRSLHSLISTIRKVVNND